jgi:hypothetical protein
MNQAVRMSQVLACAVGWMACSFPRPPQLADPDDAHVVDALADSPSDAVGSDAIASDGPGSDAPPPPQFLSCAQMRGSCTRARSVTSASAAAVFELRAGTGKLRRYRHR